MHVKSTFTQISANFMNSHFWPLRTWARSLIVRFCCMPMHRWHHGILHRVCNCDALHASQIDEETHQGRKRGLDCFRRQRPSIEVDWIFILWYLSTSLPGIPWISDSLAHRGTLCPKTISPLFELHLSSLVICGFACLAESAWRFLMLISVSLLP